MRSHPLRAPHLWAASLIALLMLATGVVGTARAAEAADGDSWTFATANGRRLDVQNGNTGDGVFVVANNTPGHHQNWRLVPLGHGEFQVANTVTGKCLTEGFPLSQQACGKAGQEWHFRPVAGKPNTFTLVRRTNDRCLDIVQGAQHTDAWTQVYRCNGTGAQEWTVSAAKQPEAMRLATDYYARLCATSTSTCSWKQTSEGDPRALPLEKASSVWYNDTSEKVTQVFTTIYRSGWSQSFSAGVSTSLGVSAPLQAMISSQLTSTTTYQVDESEINGVLVTVPSKNYGWVDFAAVAKEVTGTWTFDRGGSPWTTEATVMVPVVDSSAGSTMYIAHTGPTPPGGDPAGTEAQPQTYEKTATTTLTIPDGYRAAAEEDRLLVVDSDGVTHAVIRPGTLRDTTGRTQPVHLRVEGTTLIQTIGDGSGTVTGTMTAPGFSVGQGASLASPTAKTSSAVARQVFFAPAAALGAAAEGPRHKEWHDCMRKEMNKAVVGAVVGGVFAGGPAGAAAGLLGGAFGGYFIGKIQCGPEPDIGS
ncbi:RICIN domain-containing protein [Streptomyces fradiae]|uniref:RICIN domain-containing protein n=1 Tax=Streptomyces fradiae TaxID=1906 RepID=UPI00340DF5A7